MKIGGVFSIFKPKGISSANAIARVKHVLIKYTGDRKIKVGHGGTLDPFATGVLAVGIGDGCKVLTSFLHGSKEYIAQGQLGIETDTLDITGKIVNEKPFECSREQLEAVLPHFRGKIMQTPPAYSALRVNGERSYDLARKGTPVELKPREVKVYNLECTDLNPPFFQIKAAVSSGTYIRTIVHDIGKALSTVATCTELERTKQGPFLLEHCLYENDWNGEKIVEQLRLWNKHKISELPKEPL
eukprot:TRINITY_DN11423_c0_g1_i1.p1 TRINITY_DN11423_c0_g1~~TRINITY_DN11423_c0_g1_i1.p1  ORF type:complete len:243 (-),score=60.36 TRINITY_DN11423_c0_g1_i1:211-939(-)